MRAIIACVARYSGCGYGGWFVGKREVIRGGTEPISNDKSASVYRWRDVAIAIAASLLLSHGGADATLDREH